MPTSQHNQLNEIVNLIILANPKSILDIGVGFGKYGFLAREYLELQDGRQKYRDWGRTIDGIEAFKGYKTPVYDFIYDKVYFGNALKIIPKLRKRYDLILLIDVLEHFSRKDGVKLLRECGRHGRNVIVSTPKKVIRRKDAFGNQFEAHKSQWKGKHFSMFRRRFFVPNRASLICFMGDNSGNVRKKWIKTQIGDLFYPYSSYMYRKMVKERIKERAPFLKYPYKALVSLFNKLFSRWF